MYVIALLLHCNKRNGIKVASQRTVQWVVKVLSKAVDYS